jgi:hypothetical protein
LFNPNSCGHCAIEVLYQDGTTETFPPYSFIECGDPDVVHDPQKHKHTDYSMPQSLEEFPQLLYVTEKAGDLCHRYLKDIREIRAL